MEEEEDGVVLLAVTDTTTGDSFLSILRPSDLHELGRVLAPATINVGLHAYFFPDLPLLCKI